MKTITRKNMLKCTVENILMSVRLPLFQKKRPWHIDCVPINNP